MSKRDLPSVPPAGRSNKGTGADPEIEQASGPPSGDGEPRRRGGDKQGRQGNIPVNTRNQGYQQDR